MMPGNEFHPAVRARIAALGANFNAAILAEMRDAYRPLLESAPGDLARHLDIAYGPHDRHRMDVYAPLMQGTYPVVLFIPGGGFVGGDKRFDEVFYENVGRWFVSRGFVAAAMNYRLAPDHVWPSGREDVASAVQWITDHAHEYGGNRDAIFGVGHSAGATHLASFLFSSANASLHRRLRAAVLVSGSYALDPELLSDNAKLYFSSANAEAASPFDAIEANEVPILLAVAEFDPAGIRSHGQRLADRLAGGRSGRPELTRVEGHNHISTVLGFGTSDDRFGRRLEQFMMGVAS
jgi:arylformamidase